MDLVEAVFLRVFTQSAIRWIIKSEIAQSAMAAATDALWTGPSHEYWPYGQSGPSGPYVGLTSKAPNAPNAPTRLLEEL
jgi:hypothetical protein